MKISCIIISAANTPTLHKITKDCLNSLRKSEGPHRLEIIVVESAPVSPYGNADRTIRPKGKFNYNNYCNQGSAHATGRLIGFFNNDLIFKPGWSEAIVKALNENPDLGSVSPWCGRSHPALGAKKNTGVHYGHKVRRHVAGWAILIKREALQEIGPLDEGVEFHYSDDLYIAQLLTAGIAHGLVTGAQVDHLESRTLHSLPKRKQHDFTQGQKKPYVEVLKDRYNDSKIPKKKWQ